MSTHEVSIDEQSGDDYAARAFCACGWAGDVWHHADALWLPVWHHATEDGWRCDAVLAAFGAAEADGAQHLADEADDPTPRIQPCEPCGWGEHADDGSGTPCPCCGAECPEAEPESDPARFRALRVPPVGRDGFADPEAAL